ncbi:hypothetical protein CRUP_019873 [Coryphaenoides rupestris]|nr:hypothetical protein CRUP_019873 [Coryphaenoides rupestris]
MCLTWIFMMFLELNKTEVVVLKVLLDDVLLLLCDVTSAGETQEEDSLDQLTLNKSLVAPRLPNSVPGFPVTGGYWDNQHQVKNT